MQVDEIQFLFEKEKAAHLKVTHPSLPVMCVGHEIDNLRQAEDKLAELKVIDQLRHACVMDQSETRQKLEAQIFDLSDQIAAKDSAYDEVRSLLPTNRLALRLTYLDQPVPSQ